MACQKAAACSTASIQKAKDVALNLNSIAELEKVDEASLPSLQPKLENLKLLESLRADLGKASAKKAEGAEEAALQLTEAAALVASWAETAVCADFDSILGRVTQNTYSEVLLPPDTDTSMAAWAKAFDTALLPDLAPASEKLFQLQCCLAAQAYRLFVIVASFF